MIVGAETFKSWSDVPDHFGEAVVIWDRDRPNVTVTSITTFEDQMWVTTKTGTIETWDRYIKRWTRWYSS